MNKNLNKLLWTVANLLAAGLITLGLDYLSARWVPNNPAPTIGPPTLEQTAPKEHKRGRLIKLNWGERTTK